MDERLWLEAAASVQSELDAEVRDEAFDVFVAEAGRCRLVDRDGRIRVNLRCGQAIVGVVAPGAWPDSTLAVRVESGDLMLICEQAVVTMTGTTPRLRIEAGLSTSLGSTLREVWGAGHPVRLLLTDGRLLGGTLLFVGADHVDLRSPDGAVTVPFSAVDAWNLGEWG
jgi:hypothetical protein